MLKRRILATGLLFLVAFSLLYLLTIESLTAQSESGELRIVSLDSSDFPRMIVQVRATDARSNAITNPLGLVLSEDGSSVGKYDSELIDPGAELIIVIDANETIEQRDETAGLTRREKVRDSITRYANHFMDPMQLDRVTILVPDGASDRILDHPDLSFPNEVINAVNFYETGELSEPDLNAMLEHALEIAAENQDQDRYQAILFFSDATDLAERLDTERLVATAQDQDVAFYGAILGTRADDAEVAAVTSLTEPTGGAYVHLPDSVRADPLFEAIQQRAAQLILYYRSAISTSGRHVLTAELNDAQDEIEFEVNVVPPSVHLAVDNSRPIRRVADDPQTPLELIEPTRQRLVAQVEWPDEHPRTLTEAKLLVNGSEMPTEQAILDDSGLLTFEWDIRFLDEGSYDLQIKVVDDLGLEAVSEPLPLTILVERPGAPATLTTIPEPTRAPLVPAIETESPTVNLFLVAAGVIVFLIVLIVFVLVIFFVRGRTAQASQKAGPPVHGLAAAPPVAQSAMPPGSYHPERDYTYIIPPEFVLDETVNAYLEVLENAPEHEQLVPLNGSNISLGRDSNRVQIAFKDRSVSRLHARVMESRGNYRIYDEGSSSGTYVNYERLGLSPMTLNDNDHIHIGRVHLRFRLAASLRAQKSGRPGGSDTDANPPHF